VIIEEDLVKNLSLLFNLPLDNEITHSKTKSLKVRVLNYEGIEVGECKQMKDVLYVDNYNNLYLVKSRLCHGKGNKYWLYFTYSMKQA